MDLILLFGQHHYFLQLAEQAEPKLRGPEQIAWLHRLDVEVDNLREALQWSLSADLSKKDKQATRWDSGIRLAGALWMFWEFKGFFSLERLWLEKALAKKGDEISSARAKALSGAGTMAWHQGDINQAAKYHEDSLAIYQKMNDPAGIAFELNNVACQYHDRALYVQADRLFKESLACYREFGDPWGIGLVLKNLGSTARNRGDPLQASLYYQDSYGYLQKSGDQRLLAIHQLYTGEVALDLGRPDEAIVHFEQALNLFQRFGERTYMVDFILRIHGDIALLHGEVDQAADYYRKRLQLCQELSDKNALIETIERLARVFTAKAEFAISTCLLGAADQLRTELDIPLSQAVLPSHQQVLAEVQKKFARPAFEEAWANGQAVAAEGWEKVVACALSHIA